MEKEDGSAAITRFILTSGEDERTPDPSEFAAGLIEGLKSGGNEHTWGLKKNSNSWKAQSGYTKYPVLYVTWYGANEYCKWLTEQTNKQYRLPSEAEWEFGARGGKKGAPDRFMYSGSNKLGEYAWYDENSYDKGESHQDYGTHPVKGKKANQLGLYDMSGNVWEWCSDWYDDNYYSKSPSHDPILLINPNKKDTYRVLRGGSWYNFASISGVANRIGGSPNYWNSNGGFRLTRDL